MRVLFLSDSHGDRAGIRLMAEAAARGGRLDAALHLGDGASDFIGLTAFFQQLNPDIALHGVRGNCDFGSDVPEEEEVCLGGVRIFMTHGHRYYVKSGLYTLDDEAVRRHAENPFVAEVMRELGPLLTYGPHVTLSRRISDARAIPAGNPGPDASRKTGESAS